MTGHLIDILNEWLSEYRAIFIHSSDEPDMVIKPDFHNRHGKSAARRMPFYLPNTNIITRVRDKNLMIFNQSKDIEYWAAFQGRLIYLYSLVLLIPEDKLPA